jgi:uncharacterized short protein YbdD (DUF466 family)
MKYLRSLWQFLREATGDDAYERYLAHHRMHHPGRLPLSPRDYYRQQQESKWSKVSRCC